MKLFANAVAPALYASGTRINPTNNTFPVSRRSFVKTTAAAALGIMGSRVLPSPVYSADKGAVAAPWRMRLSTSSIHFKDLPIEQACERIAALGFEAIDIWSPYDKCQHLDDVASRLGPDGLRALLERTKLKLYAFSVYRGGYAKYAELLGKAGGGVAVDGSAAPGERALVPPEELVPRMRDFMERMKPLVELAEQHNSFLAIENHGRALLDSLDSLKAFVDLNRHPRLGIALAPYHLQAINASVEEAIAICGSQLLFFYAWQKQPEMDQFPGHGPTDFKPWLSALAKVDYRWYVNPFMHGRVEPDAMAVALAKARDYLKQNAPGA